MNLLFWGLLLAASAACQPIALTSPKPAASPSAKPSVSASVKPSASPDSGSKSLNTYTLELKELFKISSEFSTQDVSSAHKEIIAEAEAAFIDDMAEKRTADYFNEPDFAIKLLAGSEGSYFQTSEALSKFTSEALSYAMAVVIGSDGTSLTYKGQLIDQTFYFDGADSLPENNTAYLITLTENLDSHVMTGSLKPFSVQAETASPSPSASATASAQPTAAPGKLDLQVSELKKQIEDLRREIARLNQELAAPPPLDDYKKHIRDFRLEPGQFGPPIGEGPPECRPVAGFVGPGRYISDAELEDIRKKQPEVATALNALRGRPPAEHYNGVLAIYQAHKDLFTSEPPRCAG
ncbi:MAG TPA: hypothetical protein V6D23_12665 [Candidatus Obscuribacterales bacterium]